MMKVAILCVAALATASAFTPAAFVPMKGSVAGFKPALRSGSALLRFHPLFVVRGNSRAFMLHRWRYLLCALISICSAAAPRVASPLSLQAKADFEISDGVKYELNPFVLAASFYGWVLPTALIPSNIPLYGSKVIFKLSNSSNLWY